MASYMQEEGCAEALIGRERMNITAERPGPKKKDG
jgi:hypothetical protein